jgi:hypothetical protein
MSEKTAQASTNSTRGEPKPIANIIGGRQLEAGGTAQAPRCLRHDFVGARDGVV